jgi:hypothetical protein
MGRRKAAALQRQLGVDRSGSRRQKLPGFIFPVHSLIPSSYFPDTTKKFPVSFHQQKHAYALQPAWGMGILAAAASPTPPKSRFFPVIFPVSREFNAETGSQETATTATQVLDSRHRLWIGANRRHSAGRPRVGRTPYAAKLSISSVLDRSSLRANFGSPQSIGRTSCGSTGQ